MVNGVGCHMTLFAFDPCGVRIERVDPLAEVRLATTERTRQ